MRIKKLNFFLFAFRLSCFGVFFYQALSSFEDYSKKNTLADVRFIKQDRYPLPSICITTSQFSFDSFNNTFNITSKEYVKGNWKVNSLSEKELWDFLSPTLPNLIKKIKLYKTIKNDSEEYSTVIIPVDKLPGFGVDIDRKDYHSHPRIFCLSLRKDLFPLGIMKMNIYQRSKLQLYIIPPGGYYTNSRKANSVDIEKGYNYGYTLTYGIFKKFNKNNLTCNERLNFLEDECRLNKVKCKTIYYHSHCFRIDI